MNVLICIKLNKILAFIAYKCLVRENYMFIKLKPI